MMRNLAWIVLAAQLSAAGCQPQAKTALSAGSDYTLSGGNLLCCETWSLHSLFKNKDHPLKLEEFPAKMKELGIKGLALNDHFFTSWDQPCLEKIKGAVEANGRIVAAFIIDINGNFATEDEEKWKKNLEAVRDRLKSAKFLGAPLVRINAGRTGKGPEEDGTKGVERVTAAFKSLAATAKELGLKLAIENHAGFDRADWILRAIRGSDPERVGALIDFKNWPKGTDIYAEIAKLAPHAFHVHAKATVFDGKGEEAECDYARVLKILREAGYKGAVSIESGGEGDPIEKVIKTRDLILRHWQ